MIKKYMLFSIVFTFLLIILVLNNISFFEDIYYDTDIRITSMVAGVDIGSFTSVFDGYEIPSLDTIGTALGGISDNAGPLKEYLGDSSGGLDLVLVAGALLLLVVIVIIILYLRRGTDKLSPAKENGNFRKIREIEDYIDTIKPIITRMNSEGHIDPKYLQEMLEIDSKKEEAKKMLKENNPLLEKQIHHIIERLIKLKYNVENNP